MAFLKTWRPLIFFLLGRLFTDTPGCEKDLVESKDKSGLSLG